MPPPEEAAPAAGREAGWCRKPSRVSWVKRGPAGCAGGAPRRRSTSAARLRRPRSMASTAARHTTPQAPARTPGGGRASQMSAGTRGGGGASAGAAAVRTAWTAATTAQATGQAQKWWWRSGRGLEAPHRQGSSRCMRAAVGKASYTSLQNTSFLPFSQGRRHSRAKADCSSARGPAAGEGAAAAAAAKGARRVAARCSTAGAARRAVAARTVRAARGTGRPSERRQPRRGKRVPARTARGHSDCPRPAAAAEAAARAAATQGRGRAASSCATRSSATCRSTKA